MPVALATVTVLVPGLETALVKVVFTVETAQDVPVPDSVATGPELLIAEIVPVEYTLLPVEQSEPVTPVPQSSR
jgi:hypothetical protein